MAMLIITTASSLVLQKADFSPCYRLVFKKGSLIFEKYTPIPPNTESTHDNRSVWDASDVTWWLFCDRSITKTTISINKIMDPKFFI
jgi:hypothetical protein